MSADIDSQKDFRLVKGTVAHVDRRTVSIQSDSGGLLRIPIGKWANSVTPGQDLLIVTGKRWQLYQVFNVQTGALFSKPETGGKTKLLITVLYGLIGIVPFLGPLIVSGTCFWMIYFYLPKTLYRERYAQWQLISGLTGILLLWLALGLTNPIVLHVISGIVAASSLALHYRFTNLLKHAVDDIGVSFARSLGLASSTPIKKFSVFTSPTREWTAVECKASNF